MFPPLPPYSGLHVLVIHFPIALLFIAPLFVVLGLVAHKHRVFWSTAALVLMLAGTTAAFVATATGEAAEEGADLPDGISTTLDKHEDLARDARNLFTGLTVVYAGLIIFDRYRTVKPLRHRTFIMLTVLFLGVYGVAVLVLANAAHEGGRLVHEFGVRSPTAETAKKSLASGSPIDQHS